MPGIHECQTVVLSQQESIKVKQTRWTILFVGLCVAFGFISQANAQGLPQFVAVVDVAQLIKEHPEFTAKQKNLQAIVQAEETKFRARQQQIVDKEKALANGPHKAGTKAHQDLMEEIASDYADFDKDAKAMQRKFALENSRIMYETYKDIKQVLGQFCQARRIAQVTDYRMFVPSPHEPQSVMEDMEQKLVWFNVSLDITPYIVDQIYQRRGQAAAPKEIKDELRTAAKVQQELLKNAQQRAAGTPATATR